MVVFENQEGESNRGESSWPIILKVNPPGYEDNT